MIQSVNTVLTVGEFVLAVDKKRHHYVKGAATQYQLKCYRVYRGRGGDSVWPCFNHFWGSSEERFCGGEEVNVRSYIRRIVLRNFSLSYQSNISIARFPIILIRAY